MNAAVAAQVTIGRLACRFNLPAGLEAPTGDRLTRIARREVAQVCGEALTGLPGDDEAVYRIRRLHLEFWIDLQSMSEREMARRWGILLAKAIMRAMQRGGPEQVRRFDSPRHFVSAFLRDALDGHAWGRWYYAEFLPLQRLTVAEVALQLLLSRPAWIMPVLVELEASGHAARLLERWRAGEIARLWEALDFPPQPVFTEGDEGLKALTALVYGVALSGAPDAGSRARDRLRLWLALAQEHPAAARDPVCANLIHALVDLAALLHEEPDLAPLLLMATPLYPAMLRKVASGPLADTLGWLTSLSATDAGRVRLAHITEAVSTQRVAQPTPAEDAKVSTDDLLGGALSSPVGSVFLIAPVLAELGLWERLRDELDEETARRYLFIVMLKALGRERSPLVLGDRMLAAFAGLAKPPVADARLLPEKDGPPGAWADRLPELAARWYPARDREVTIGTAHGVQVLRDATAACWLAAYPADGRRPELATGPDRHDLSEEEQAMLAAETAHLQLGRRLGYPWLTPSLDAALSAATSLVLRRTAARLPGFGKASPAYLARQFLAQPATLHRDPEAWTVKLSGGPLAVVLRLAALPDLLRVSWLPQPLCLKG
jgi:hypothetical protein